MSSPFPKPIGYRAVLRHLRMKGAESALSGLSRRTPARESTVMVSTDPQQDDDDDTVEEPIHDMPTAPNPTPWRSP